MRIVAVVRYCLKFLTKSLLTVVLSYRSGCFCSLYCTTPVLSRAFARQREFTRHRAVDGAYRRWNPAMCLVCRRGNFPKCRRALCAAARQRIVEGRWEGYYQHHHGTAHKRSRSNESAGEQQKVAKPSQQRTVQRPLVIFFPFKMAQKIRTFVRIFCAASFGNTSWCR